MHELIDSEKVERIRKTGATFPNAPDRAEILKQHGLPFDVEAENAVITGCQILPGLPHILASLSRFFSNAGLSHTFLSEEFCCGNEVYRPAIKAKDEDALKQCRELSYEFVSRNLKRAKELGAKRLIIFCSPCYPIYKSSLPDENIVFYPTVINECAGDWKLDKKIDYYAGCYRLHKKFAPVPMDLKGANNFFSGIDGLDVHRISAPKCCYKPEGAAHMMNSVQTDDMVHICTGCYVQALVNAPKDKKLNILMLPEFAEMVHLHNS